jgi:hypothetical protein
MRTKAYHAFEQKLIYFDDDLDLIDVLRTSIVNGDLTDADSKQVLKNVDPQKHTHISRRKNGDGSRKAVINHLRGTLYSSYFKDVYEEVTHYLKTILEKSAENGFDSGRIIGEHTCKFDAKAILEAGDWKSITTMIADSVFQSLEAEKSTLKLFQKISNKLALNIDQKLIDAALPYLEVRHFLVHADGLLPQDFVDNNPGISVKNGFVQIDYKLVNGLRKTVKELIKAYDEKVIAGQLLKAEDTQP